MTYKQIEASREARLWLTQVVIPMFGVAMMVPEVRNAVGEKLRDAKKAIETQFNKK